MLLWTVFGIGLLSSLSSQISGEKIGNCPPLPSYQLPEVICKDIISQCQNDTQCADELKCCSNGCTQVCTSPIFSGCHQIRNIFGRQAKLFEEEEVFVPRCRDNGEFEPIQCDKKGQCWCTDAQGFELAGTRAASYEQVNCSAPKSCAGFLCRMLCSYGFALDEEGCPLCQCRNPCDNFKCPESQECQVEDLPCGDEICPPLPTCKQPRSLEDLCPMGNPLSSPETGNPILCGVEPNKPQCPHNYLCEVQSGNDYGVCCSLIEKPGECPSVSQDVRIPGECPTNCSMDIDCEGVSKCCPLEGCSKSCLKPANTTLCLQQKAVVELLLGYKPDYEGYIPQCSEAGEFIPKQCSLNGKLCWCVTDNGTQIRGSMGPANQVNCEHPLGLPSEPTKEIAPSNCKDANEMCDLTCNSGYKYDNNGCIICECANPCESIQCPIGTECLLMKVEPCFDENCSLIPTCQRNSNKPCDYGSPFIQKESGEVLKCGSNECPVSYTCKVNFGDSEGVCCPQTTERTNNPSPHHCPEYIPETVSCGNSTCTNDNDCQNGLMCCISQTCGPICVPHKLPRLPTICEYLKEMSFKLAQQEVPQKLAIPIPTCHPDGSYKSRQCDQDHCWCVDEFGTELNNSRVANYQPLDCSQVRSRLNCNGLVCRLGCDYGFDLDENGCPLCDCRDPCKSAICPEKQECKVVEAHCGSNWCPPIPQCVPAESPESRKVVYPKCPIGNPILYDDDLPVTCDPNSQYQQCPPYTHTCIINEDHYDSPGVCCPNSEIRDQPEQRSQVNLTVTTTEVAALKPVFIKNGTCPAIGTRSVSGCDDSCEGDSDCPDAQKCCVDNCGALTCLNPEGFSQEKAGQCPYLVPLSSHQCSLECSDDSNCMGDSKCCSNGCGTRCTQPLLLTACQHQRLVSEHQAHEMAIPASRMFMPTCSHEDGEFEPIQCHPLSRVCWCVDNKGMEIVGTRGLPEQMINCTALRTCPILECNLPCEHGYSLSEDGCPICQCRNPCEGVICSNPSEECRLVQVRCTTEPCLPIPLCLPRLDNPCLSGEPLPDINAGGLLNCGPTGSQCPSSHKCHLSPLGEYAVCCPKPRDVCYQEMNPGPCESFTSRWYYNQGSNQCERFTYGGCDGTLNNFETEEQCRKTCAVMSSCERTREHNLKLKKNYNRVVFLPKCNRVTRDWDPIQCLDSLGLCWCVTPNGEQIPGTVIRGIPHCNARSGRTYTGDVPLCEDGRPVYVCPSHLCDHKICLTQPNATCRINPCGGCNIEFYDEINRKVNCEEGLSACQLQLQHVLNSPAWKSHNIAREDIQHLLPSKHQGAEDNFPPYPPPPPPQHMSETMDHRSSVLPLLVSQDDNTDDLEAIASSHHISILVISPKTERIDSVGGLAMEMQSSLQPILESASNILARMHSEPVNKPGACPSPSILSFLRLLSGSCPDHCHSDGQCAGTHKCCFTKCGMRCIKPIFEEKPGKCPTPSTSALGRFLCLFKQHDCMVDGECVGKMKCCPSQCGNSCKKPIVEHKPVHMVVTLPVCSSEGGYAITQRQEDLSWCVDEYGTPIDASLTRGNVRCSVNGTIISKEGDHVCPNGIQPKVCKDECLSTTCFQHPDSICITDPCKDCEVIFVNNEGEKLNCDDQCHQPAEFESCQDFSEQYFFNQTSQQCQQVIQEMICLTTDNKFYAMEDCRLACERPVPICQQPREIGMCRAQIPRWSYNKQNHQCEPFYYGGCGGNENNFETKEECEARCPDLVMCPWATITGQDIEACSRSLACAGSSCPSHSEAICTVDPCTCTAVFVNKSGTPLNCERVPSENPSILIKPNIPEYTRCQSLHMRYSSESITDYIPQCDSYGEFKPKQCTTPRRLDNQPECWCVNEAGLQLAETRTFPKNNHTCRFVKVKRVEVTLAFQHTSPAYAEQKMPVIKHLVGGLLKELSAEIDKPELHAIISSDTTLIKFNLIGNSKVQVAYQLEEMIKYGSTQIQLPEALMAADFRKSHFYHISEYDPSNVLIENLNDPSVIANRVAKSIVEREPLILLAIISMLIIVGCFICIIISSKRKNSQKMMKPKPINLPMFSQQAFSSLLYNITGKKHEDKYPEEKKDPTIMIQTIESQYESLQVKDEDFQIPEPPPLYTEEEKEKH